MHGQRAHALVHLSNVHPERMEPGACRPPVHMHTHIPCCPSSTPDSPPPAPVLHLSSAHASAPGDVPARATPQAVTAFAPIEVVAAAAQRALAREREERAAAKKSPATAAAKRLRAGGRLVAAIQLWVPSIARMIWGMAAWAIQRTMPPGAGFANCDCWVCEMVVKWLGLIAARPSWSMIGRK